MSVIIRSNWCAPVMDVLTGFFTQVGAVNDRDWHGGFFCIADGQTGLPHMIQGFGAMPSTERAAASLEFCQEKAIRLAAHQDHRTSYESRNPDQSMWGGAIRTNRNRNRHIFSFSGLPEKLDEAVMLVTAIRAEYLTEQEARSIVVANHNELFEKALEASRHTVSGEEADPYDFAKGPPNA